MIIFKELQLVKEMITELVIYQIIPHFKEYCEFFAIDLGTERAGDADRKTIQQINLTGNLHQDETIFLLLKKQKKQF